MSQKSRKSRPRPSRPAARPVAESPRSRPTLRDVHVREDLATAAEREGSPAIPVSALIVTTLLVGAYLHCWCCSR